MANQISISGNLGNDPEISVTAKGDSMAKFSVADNSGGKAEPPIWWKVIAYRYDADFCRGLRKGQRVTVFGKVKPYTYTHRETGEQRQALSISASHVAADKSENVVSFSSEETAGEEIPF
jgi:single-stranded DNA-binding protein|tara:strand:- start:3794 stop:4153 length:360 start_codon:yes stop_codon:yes gene_type:complete